MYGSYTLRLLAEGNHERAARIVCEGGIALLCDAIKSHSNDWRILRQVCAAVSVLGADSGSRSLKMAEEVRISKFCAIKLNQR